MTKIGVLCVFFTMITPPKFNSSPLKSDGWKTTFPFGMVYF